MQSKAKIAKNNRFPSICFHMVYGWETVKPLCLPAPSCHGEKRETSEFPPRHTSKSMQIHAQKLARLSSEANIYDEDYASQAEKRRCKPACRHLFHPLRAPSCIGSRIRIVSVRKLLTDSYYRMAMVL